LIIGYTWYTASCPEKAALILFNHFKTVDWVNRGRLQRQSDWKTFTDINGNEDR